MPWLRRFRPITKIARQVGKTTIPGRKTAYRLRGRAGKPLLNVLVSAGTPTEKRPQAGKPIMCLHPFEAQKRSVVTRSQVTCMHTTVWQNGCATALPDSEATKAFCRK